MEQVFDANKLDHCKPVAEVDPAVRERSDAKIWTSGRLVPVGKLVVVIPEELSDNITAGGIIIPESARKISQTGIVAAIGNGVKKDLASYMHRLAGKDGRNPVVVVYNRYAGTAVETEWQGVKKTVLLMDESEILAVIEQKDFYMLQGDDKE